MMSRFFVESLEAASGLVSLPKGEAHHAVDVMRLKPGAAIELFDGRGGLAEAVIESIGSNSVIVRVMEIQHVEEVVPRLTLATALPKGKRWQGLVEKCTELGVCVIQPVYFTRSVVKPEDSIEKWQRWSLEAAKQCGRAFLPVFKKPVNLEGLLGQDSCGPCLLADPNGDSIIKWGGQIERAGVVMLIVGPEGGLTDEERAACFEAVCAPVVLGNNILRIETAAIAGCAMIRGLNA